jgi:hypothetical protein
MKLMDEYNSKIEQIDLETQGIGQRRSSKMLAQAIVEANKRFDEEEQRRKIVDRKKLQERMKKRKSTNVSVSETDDDEERQNMLKELQEGSVNSASNIRGTNIRLNVKTSINTPYQPTSFKLLKTFLIFLIIITFTATQILLIYQTVYYERLRKALKAQTLLFKYESKFTRVWKI